MFDKSFAEANFLLDDYCYLNAAYMGPLSRQSRNAGIQGIFTKENPVRIEPRHFFSHIEEIRSGMGRLLNAPPRNFSIVPSVSYGMAAIARQLPFTSRSNIVLVGKEMPSNYYVWKRCAARNGLELRVVEQEDGTGSFASLSETTQRLLDCIDSRTACVSLGIVHWIFGSLHDVEAIRKATGRRGAKLIIDGTQSVGAMPLDVSELQPDAVVVAGYKWLLGPYSIGVMYWSDDLLDGLPLEDHWLNRVRSERFEALTDYQDAYRDGARRFDVGEASNFILAPMLANAIGELNEWGTPAIYAHCAQLTAALQEVCDSQQLETLPPDRRAGHYLAARLPRGVDPDAFKKALTDRKVIVSTRDQFIRITPHVYNHLEQVEQFAEALREALRVATR